MRYAFTLPILLSLLLAGHTSRGLPERGADPSDVRELVVLVHGMGRSPLSMRALERDLTHAGYRVVNWGYSSTCCTIAELGADLRADVESAVGEAPRVHFVGHSLGNLLIRWALTETPQPANLGRIVMLAPPNQGSHEADRHGWLLGRVLVPIPELRTDPTSTARRLGVPAGASMGIIAGASDGKVTVDETRLEGALHTTVSGAHSFIMQKRAVRRLVLGFLRTGTFPTVQ